MQRLASSERARSDPVAIHRLKDLAERAHLLDSADRMGMPEFVIQGCISNGRDLPSKASRYTVTLLNSRRWLTPTK